MSLFDDFLESTKPAEINPVIHKREQPDTILQQDIKRETGYVASTLQLDKNNIFSLQYVQFRLPATLISMKVENNMLAAVLDNFRILRIDLDKPFEVDVVTISRKPNPNKIIQLFLDPTGRHIIVTTETGENHYLFDKWRRSKELSKLKDMVITSIGWNKRADMNSASTKEILIGTKDGKVYETCLEPTDEFFRKEEKYVIPLFSLPESMPITGLSFEQFPTHLRQYLVILSTPTRLYHFVGSVYYTAADNRQIDRALFESIFGDPADQKEFQTLPSDLTDSKMILFNRFPELQLKGVPQTFCWLTGSGIYNGRLDFNERGGSPLTDTCLLPFPPTGYDEHSEHMITDMPTSIIMTEFHFVLLYRHVVRAVCRLNDKIVFEGVIPLKGDEKVQGITADDIKRTYWIYTTDAIYELVIQDEDRDVWKLYLEKKDYATSLQYCKSLDQRTQVYTAQAQDDFDHRRYIQSAIYFAKSTVPFEEVVLKFTKKKERDALRFFLIRRLENLGSNDRTQKTLISTWLVQLYLTKMNQLEDTIASVNFTSIHGTISRSSQQYQKEQQDIKDEFCTFLETYGTWLHKPTTYKLIASHGFGSELLYYALFIQDYEKVVDHWINEKNWSKALEILDGQNKNELFYKYSISLMENVPERVVDIWVKHPKINPRQLIPALLRYNHSNISDKSVENQAIRYLSYVVSILDNTDPIIHNFLLTLYATQSTRDETALLTFLKNEGREMHYELDYALRVCSQNGRTQSCVHIYSQMGLYEEAVDLALEHRNLDLARINADKPEDDDELRKKLWISIAKYVIQDNKDIKTAMQFLKKIDLLKIEDILPFFPDYVLIDDFKDEICSALGEYNVNIEELKSEMDNATLSADFIRLDVRKLKKRYTIIEEEQMCCICKFPLLTRQFYVFPCHHEYHVDCLRNKITKYLPTKEIRKLADIQEQLSTEYKSARNIQTIEEEKLISLKIDELRCQLDNIVAHQCLLCGDVMINSINIPFINEELDSVSSWSI